MQAFSGSTVKNMGFPVGTPLTALHSESLISAKSATPNLINLSCLLYFKLYVFIAFFITFITFLEIFRQRVKISACANLTRLN